LALGYYLETALKRAGALLAEAGAGRRWSGVAYRANLSMLAAAGAAAWLAGREGILRPQTAALLMAMALVAFAFVYYFRRTLAPRRAWIHCGVTCFILLLGSIHLVLPGYARRFAMRGQVRPVADMVRGRHLPVISYPRGWDSVSFYLGRDDVRVYTEADRQRLLAELGGRAETLAFIKSDQALADLVRNLPSTLEFVPQGRQGYVTAGVIRRRIEVPSYLWAGP
jgi:hypothetical protein